MKRKIIIILAAISICAYLIRLDFKEKTDYKTFAVLESLSYLKVRALGARKMFNENYVFKDINDLLKAIEKDDIIIEDLRKREIIGNFLTLYSPLLNFRNSEKLISESRSDVWIDYSTQKLENNIYYVEVSDYVCRKKNRYSKKENIPCVNNIYKLNLN